MSNAVNEWRSIGTEEAMEALFYPTPEARAGDRQYIDEIEFHLGSWLEAYHVSFEADVPTTWCVEHNIFTELVEQPIERIRCLVALAMFMDDEHEIPRKEISDHPRNPEYPDSKGWIYDGCFNVDVGGAVVDVECKCDAPRLIGLVGDVDAGTVWEYLDVHRKLGVALLPHDGARNSGDDGTYVFDIYLFMTTELWW